MFMQSAKDVESRSENQVFARSVAVHLLGFGADERSLVLVQISNAARSRESYATKNGILSASAEDPMFLCSRTTCSMIRIVSR